MGAHDETAACYRAHRDCHLRRGHLPAARVPDPAVQQERPARAHPLHRKIHPVAGDCLPARLLPQKRAGDGRPVRRAVGGGACRLRRAAPVEKQRHAEHLRQHGAVYAPVAPAVGSAPARFLHAKVA